MILSKILRISINVLLRQRKMLNSWQHSKDNSKTWHLKRDSMWFSKRYPVWWMDWKWFGLFLEITRILKKCKNWFLWLLIKLLIKFRIQFKFLSFLTWTKKHKKSYKLLRIWLFKENKFFNSGMLNSKRLKLQWMINNLKDGSSNPALLLKDANIWSIF